MILLFGTPTAYFLATRRFPGRALLVTLVELPIVLPPAVAGIGLIVAFGRVGLLGSTFDRLGIDVSFNQAAVVLAITLVSGPFYVRQAIAAFEAVDAEPRRRVADARRRAGADVLPGRLAARARRACGGRGDLRSPAASASSARRSCSRAASRASTQTLPLAVYTVFEANFDVALAISALLVVISLAILLSLKAQRPVAALEADFALPLRSFQLELALEVEGTVALVGPSGAGKTSVLRAIAGLVRPAAGRIALGGEVWFDAARRRLPPA